MYLVCDLLEILHMCAAKEKYDFISFIFYIIHLSIFLLVGGPETVLWYQFIAALWLRLASKILVDMGHWLRLWLVAWRHQAIT